MFRHPKTQNERRSDQALLNDPDAEGMQVKGRVRSGKSKQGIPTAWDDINIASNADRSRGKKSHSPARKVAKKNQDQSFD